MTNPRVCLRLIACCLTILLTAPIAVRAEEVSPSAQPALANRLPAFQDVARANAAQLSTLPAQGMRCLYSRR